jgi:uncharacterized radical SAM superfamily Fe-S cluster-containing enzyme
MEPRPLDPNERFHHLEIEINSVCDVNCPMCDRFSDVAVDRSMTVKQIEKLIADSIELDWPWERITILGGEPTIHPKFRETVVLLTDYKRSYRPDLLLQVFTNGQGRLEENRQFILDQGCVIYCAYKDGTIPPYFDNMWTAPVDTIPGEQEACAIFRSDSHGIRKITLSFR